MSTASDPSRMHRLLDAGRALVAELDPQAVLDKTLAAAREVTGAQYAALGILDEERTGLEQFLTLGLGEAARHESGEPPVGTGVLGVLIDDPRPLRLADFAADPRSAGTPAGHPVMHTFLGVPILVEGVACGGLYLAEKQGGAFTEADEEVTVILAEWAATAVDNARLYRAGEPARAVVVEAAGETSLERVLELVVARGRTLALTREDELLLRSFASSAAAAVALAQSVESDRLRSLMAAAEAERSRWARELHDETLQGLGALRLLLAAARRRGDAEVTLLAVDEAIEHVTDEIENLHAIISDLRPAALDELGLRPALEALFERRRDDGALVIADVLTLPDVRARENRLDPEVESTIYRVVQEAITNVVKHAGAREVRVSVIAADETVSIEVRDDGVGFTAGDTDSPGFGLTGLRERVLLAGGTVTIGPGESTGTVVRAEVPARPAGTARRSGPAS